MSKIQIYYFSGTGNTANNLHLPILCPLKVTKKQKIDKRLVRIDNKIDDIVVKINNKIKDIRGNDLIGKIFGVSQRSIGKVHEELNFKGFSSAPGILDMMDQKG